MQQNKKETDKPSKNITLSNPSSQKNSKVAGLIDNRPTSEKLTQFQKMADKSVHVLQLKKYQQIADISITQKVNTKALGLVQLKNRRDVIQRVALDSGELILDHSLLLDHDGLFNEATATQKGLSNLFNAVDTEKKKRDKMDASSKETEEYVELERLRVKLNNRQMERIKPGSKEADTPGVDSLDSYGTIFGSHKLSKDNPRTLATHKIVMGLHSLYDAYKSLAPIKKNITAKLQIANQISQKALELPESETFKKIRHSLQKFPHVVLSEDQAVSLEDLTRTVNELGDKTRELGLLNLTGDDGKSSLGLFYGTKEPGREGVGAMVSAPGRSTAGFGGLKASFIAHTHPRELESQHAHSEELKTDIEGAHGMEMVREHYGDTYFYDQRSAKNKTNRGKFTNEIDIPDSVFHRINHFTKLSNGYKYKDITPTEQQIDKAKLDAKTQAEEIKERILKAQHALQNTSLTRDQYLINLEIVQRNLELLENDEISEFSLWRDKFPTEEVESGDDDDPFSLFT